MKHAIRNFALMAVLLTAALIFGAAPARADQQVDEIFAKVKTVNKNLKDYKADININLSAKMSIIPYNTSMSGSYYYKAPDKHKLVLEKAPSYLKKYPNIFGWHLPDLNKYTSRVTGTTTLNGRKVWHLQLDRKGESDTRSVELWVDCENYTVPRQVTNYKRDGRLCVNVNYTEKDGYKIFDTMTAEFDFPAVSVKANASAKYANYKFNQNLPDSFFAKDKK